MFSAELERSRSKGPLVIGIVFVVLVVGIILLLPMPHTVKSTFVLVPTASATVTAPRDGVIAEIVATPGLAIARGSVIAKYDTTSLEKQLAELQAKLAPLEQQKAAKPNPGAKAALPKAEAALTAATAAVEKATGPAKAAAEKRKLAAEEALEKARVAAITPEEAGKLLATTQESIAALKAQLADATLLAPGSGVLTLDALAKGTAVKTGEKLGVVEDVSKLKARVKAPADEPLKKGQAVELLLAAGKRRVTFDADAKDGVADAEFDNSKNPLAAGLTGDAEIEGAQRSLLAR